MNTLVAFELWNNGKIVIQKLKTLIIAEKIHRDREESHYRGWAEIHLFLQIFTDAFPSGEAYPSRITEKGCLTFVFIGTSIV